MANCNFHAPFGKKMEAVQKPALVQRTVENVSVRNMLRTNFVLKRFKNLNNYYKPNRIIFIFFTIPTGVFLIRYMTNTQITVQL